MLQEDVEDYDVVIAGGGIGGLTLACGLAANGRTTCVLESRPSLARSKRGLALQPNGLAALDNLGLLTQVLGIGHRTGRVTWWEVGHGKLATFDYSILDQPHNFLLTIIPSELEVILREELSRRGGVLHESTSFLGVKHEPNGQLRVTALRNGEAIEYSARILVGADGENSNCRKTLGVRTRVKESANQYLFMLIGPVDAIRQEARQYFTRGKMLGLYPTPTSTYVFYYLPKLRFNDLRSYELRRRKQAKFVQDQSERTARVTTTENRFYYWLGKRLIRNTGADPRLMRIALGASSGLTDHIGMRDRIRFLL